GEAAAAGPAAVQDAPAPTDGHERAPAWEAWPVPGDSAILTSLTRADGIVRVPPRTRWEAGAIVDAELLASLSG
ncbi:MAG: hypothetical protein IRZ18_05990, partial [Clostridia bacterium]|nr:hypothetical protein [Clostridia bacterium]